MKKLNFLEIILIYIGVIMGAGFASGREVWQFFGVFGTAGYATSIATTFMYMGMGIMLTYNSIQKNTFDYATIISPTDNFIVRKIITSLVTIQYFLVLVSMTAAGGSLLNMEFGISKVFGGLLIAALVSLTVIGDFERISNVFTKIVPFLFSIVILTVVLVIKADVPGSAINLGHYASSLTPNPWIACLLFIAYNSVAMVTVAGKIALQAKDEKNAYIGSVLAAMCLGVLIMILLRALLTDMDFSYEMDLPLLAYAGRLSPVINYIFALVLYGAIYSAASSTLYGCSRVIVKYRHKNIIIIALSIVAFLLGLTGFKTIVEYLYPVLGYIGLGIVLLITINYFKTLIETRRIRVTK